MMLVFACLRLLSTIVRRPIHAATKAPVPFKLMSFYPFHPMSLWSHLAPTEGLYKSVSHHLPTQPASFWGRTSVHLFMHLPSNTSRASTAIQVLSWTLVGALFPCYAALLLGRTISDGNRCGRESNLEQEEPPGTTLGKRW